MKDKIVEVPPSMPDVRRLRLENRRLMTISRWPVLCASSLLALVAKTILDVGPGNARTAALATIGSGLGLILLSVFGKTITRRIIGPDAPLATQLVGPRESLSRGNVVLIVLGVVFGLAFGFVTSTALGDRLRIDVVLVSLLAATGAIASFAAAWRTRLWELAVLPLAFLAFPAVDDLGSIFIYTSLVSGWLGLSFYLRWRRWLKSHPVPVAASGGTSDE